MNDEVLNRKEAREFLKISDATLVYLVGTGQVPFSRVGKRGVRFLKSRLIEWLKEREGVEYHMNAKSA